MCAQPVQSPNPWDNRWHQPRIEQLLEPLEQNRRNLFVRVSEHLESLDAVDKDLVWLGISWKWTIRFTLKPTQSHPGHQSHDQGGHEIAFAYLVPNPRQPTVCLPLTQEQVEALPQRRLNKFIRQGIQSAKQGVEIHWCKWIATSHAEVDHIRDLANRKHQMLTNQDQGAAA